MLLPDCRQSLASAPPRRRPFLALAFRCVDLSSSLQRTHVFPPNSNVSSVTRLQRTCGRRGIFYSPLPTSQFTIEHPPRSRQRHPASSLSFRTISRRRAGRGWPGRKRPGRGRQAFASAPRSSAELEFYNVAIGRVIVNEVNGGTDVTPVELGRFYWTPCVPASDRGEATAPRTRPECSSVLVNPSSQPRFTATGS